jgi:hypothetical protein
VRPTERTEGEPTPGMTREQAVTDPLDEESTLVVVVQGRATL